MSRFGFGAHHVRPHTHTGLRSSGSSLGDVARDKAKPKEEHQDRGKVLLSAACRKGKHANCTAMKCECDCGHGVGR